VLNCVAAGCQGNAACLFRNSTYIPLGSVRSDSMLKMDSDGSLFISYAAATSSASCSSPASTKVTFRCPQRGKVSFSSNVSRIFSDFVANFIHLYANCFVYPTSVITVIIIFSFNIESECLQV